MVAILTHLIFVYVPSARDRCLASPQRLTAPGVKRRRTIYTAGRPPWYDHQGQMVEAFVIGLAGGSASGKTTVARKIIEALHMDWVSVLSMDSFYKVLNAKQHEDASRSEYNFDHPGKGDGNLLSTVTIHSVSLSLCVRVDAFDFDLMVTMLKKLKDGKKIEVPVYDFATHSRAKYTVRHHLMHWYYMYTC